ncbi:MAG TPA: S1 RNA-binding domain-containing protein [Anaerolineae bacterium]|nr:S1 RNA-binding domain-containing protein [Anaerolineae bacterium]
MLNTQLFANSESTQPIEASIDTETLSFEDMLQQYEPEPIQQGQYISGQIVLIEDNMLLADVDAKRTAIVPPQDLAQIDEEILTEIHIGDEVLLYVPRTPLGDDDLIVSLQRGIQYQDWNRAQEYLENQELVELLVIGTNKGGILVEFGHLRGFVPNSHLPQLQHLHRTPQIIEAKEAMIGTKLPLQVIEVQRRRRRLVLSAKEASAKVREQRLIQLKEQEGEVVTGTVSNLVDFGAFIDLGGVQGLVHISEIDWQQVHKSSDYFTVGEQVELLIKEVDVERERVSLSRKALVANPWEQFADDHHVGELLSGVVTNVVDFGAFLAIKDNIEGLLHVSQMRGSRDMRPQDVLQTGDTVLVRIISLEPERERLGLSQRQVTQEEELEWVWQQEATIV